MQKKICVYIVGEIILSTKCKITIIIVNFDSEKSNIEYSKCIWYIILYHIQSWLKDTIINITVVDIIAWLSKQ